MAESCPPRLVQAAALQLRGTPDVPFGHACAECRSTAVQAVGEEPDPAIG